MKNRWVKISELANILGININTLLTYLCRAEFNLYTKITRKEKEFYLCSASRKTLYDFLYKKQRYYSAKYLKEEYEE